MHILLINTNPVVSRLLSLCVRDVHTLLDEITNVSNIVRDSYDIILIDDASWTEEMKNRLLTLNAKKKVFLSSKNNHAEDVENFDEIIFKPFLPSRITALFEDIDVSEVSNDEVENTSFIFPLSVEEDEDLPEEKKEEPVLEDDEVDLLEIEDASILDSVEIEKIKSLLQEDDEEIELIEPEDDSEYETRKIEVIKQQLEADGLEIVSEEEYVESLHKKKKKKKNKSKKIQKNKEDTFTFEEALLAAIEGMKIKKIKKLLKGADIRIQIKFKDADAK